jgi:hypothetical protein
MTPSLNIGKEIAQVQRELRLFRREYLPLLTEPVSVDDRWAYAATHNVALGANARIWEAATFSVADTLPLPPDDRGSLFRPEDYAGLYRQARNPGFQIRDGQIVWEISIFMPVRVADDPKLAAHFGGPYQHVGQIVDWLLLLPLDDGRLWKGLSILLPAVAMEDEERAEDLLTTEFWVNRLREDRNRIPLKDSHNDSEEFIQSGCFRHIMNSSVLHVLAALANNRFSSIGRFLQLQTRYGHYTKLMPAFIFSVLCEKVLILKRLSVSGPSC